MARLAAALATLWHSPTITTFGGFAVRSLSLVILLPLVLVRLTAEEISVWYLFAAIASLQVLLDLGFSSTFARVVAYAMGGTGVHALGDPRSGGAGAPEWDAVARIWSTIHYLYLRLAACWLLLLGTLGTLAVRGPIALLPDGAGAWWGWALVAAASAIALRGMAFSSFLLGVGEVALVRRWDIATALGSLLSAVAVLLLTPDLLALVIAYYVWPVLNVLRNRWLARQVLGGRTRTFPGPRRDALVLAAVWPSGWRTAIGTATVYGLVQVSGVIFAQFNEAATAAAYFVALRLIQAVSQASQAPFYSKLPAFARLYAEGRKDELIRRARRGMAYAYLVFVAGFILLGVMGGPLLTAIGAKVEFPAPAMWGLLGIAFFAERYGAMHLNLYATTNKVINHIVGGGAGITYVIAGIALLPVLGMHALPVALIAGNAVFFVAYTASRSYRALDLDPWSFERGAVLPYLAIVAAYLVATLLA
jgi:hypothetical protein